MGTDDSPRIWSSSDGSIHLTHKTLNGEIPDWMLAEYEDRWKHDFKMIRTHRINSCISLGLSAIAAVVTGTVVSSVVSTTLAGVLVISGVSALLFGGMYALRERVERRRLLKSVATELASILIEEDAEDLAEKDTYVSSAYAAFFMPEWLQSMQCVQRVYESVRNEQHIGHVLMALDALEPLFSFDTREEAGESLVLSVSDRVTGIMDDALSCDVSKANLQTHDAISSMSLVLEEPCETVDSSPRHDDSIEDILITRRRIDDAVMMGVRSSSASGAVIALSTMTHPAMKQAK